MNIKKTSYPIAQRYIRQKRIWQPRKTETETYTKEIKSSQQYHLKDMYNRLDLPEQKNIIIVHPFIYKRNTFTESEKKT